MVDWAAVRERQRERRQAELASMEPEAREAENRRVAMIAEREERAAETEAPITGHFERETWAREAVVPVRQPMALGLRAIPAPKPKQEFQDGLACRQIVKTWEAELTIRIEARENDDGSEREIIRFVGGPTGHEAYALDASLARLLTDPAEREGRPRWYICAGTPDRWDACWVDRDAIEVYLRERRPSLFPESVPCPGGPVR